MAKLTAKVTKQFDAVYEALYEDILPQVDALEEKHPDVCAMYSLFDVLAGCLLASGWMPADLMECVTDAHKLQFEDEAKEAQCVARLVVQ